MKRLSEHQDDWVEELIHRVISVLPQYLRRPAATYRLQLNRNFGFRDAAALVGYLADLGITDLYLSPCLKAAAGSEHGYDVVDHQELNPELGTAADFDALAAALSERGMGILLDFVPNHMAIGSENPLWMDVLENGPSSIWAHFFDVDWHPIKEELHNRVLVPILGDQYGAVLERGELTLHYEGGGFHLRYFNHVFPVAPRQYAQILKHRIDELRRGLGEESVHFQDLLSIITALSKLPPRTERDPGRIAERHREKEVIKRRLVALCESCPEARAFIEENVRIYNGRPGEPRSFDLLDALLREQAYRLAYWRVAAEEINYRRFFDINALAAIRMEDVRVMQKAHALVFRLIGERKVTGLRIDHPDGLFDPPGYFARLQEELAVDVARRLFEERAGALGEEGEALQAHWAELEPSLRERVRQEAALGRGSPLFSPLYVVVEKILTASEALPEAWAVHGTTGYDSMNLINGLFVDRRAEAAVDDAFARFTGLRFDYPELVYQMRRQIMSDSLSSEVNVLARQLNRISEHDRRTRDFTLVMLKRALVEVVACFPVYRTYLSADGGAPAPVDREFVEAAVARARRKNQAINASVFAFIRDVLLHQVDENVGEAARAERVEFVLKLQQVTGPVMAKSVEDTVFYRYNRLVSLNEVGGDPQRFGLSRTQFHRANQLRAERWPGSLVASTTHDTKRSEDVRARIDVLSELPSEWRRKLSVWSRLNRRWRQRVGERDAPDRNEELLLYQTLLGAWPFEELRDESLARFTERIQAYLAKAMKEAKANTSWVNPNEAWERATAAFVAAVLDPARSDRFWKDFLPFQRRVARVGCWNSLSQTALRCTVPGVPDLYQGQELWELTLVDPDNRQPVDFARRRALLEQLDERAGRDRAGLARELTESYWDGRIKLYTLLQALRLRRHDPRLFRDGDYTPLGLRGEKASHAVAFARRATDRLAVVVAPRLVAPLIERAPDLAGEQAWEDTFLDVPFGRAGDGWIDLYTGRSFELESVEGRVGLRLAEMFDGFPVVLAVARDMAPALFGRPAPPPAVAEGLESGQQPAAP